MKRLKVLMSAYACEPNKSSEPAVGWNVALEMAKYHDIWVLTRTNNRNSINEWLSSRQIRHLSFIFYDGPGTLLRLKRGLIGIQVYYYLWQIGAYFVARHKDAEIGFDLIHHVTFVKYWTPSLLSLLSPPFLWGPLGGGESTPREFLREFSFYGKSYEKIRGIARWIGERDPLVRLTAKRSNLSIATTNETAARLEDLGANRIEIISQCGISKEKLDYLTSIQPARKRNIVFLSIGNLLPLKGFHLGLKAFAKARLPNSEFWIIGDGPEHNRLKALSQFLGLQDHIRFWGRLSAQETLKLLGRCDVLVHPSLHDSGGFVCLEAMAAGKPVICLDQGGPGTLISSEAGIKIPANIPEQVIKNMTDAMVLLATDQDMRERMGQAGQELVAQQYTWERKGIVLAEFYRKIVMGFKEGSAPNMQSAKAVARGSL